MTPETISKVRIGEEESLLGFLEQVFNAGAIDKMLAYQESVYGNEDGPSAELKGTHYPLSERYGGDVYKVCVAALEALGLSDMKVDFFVSQTSDVNAFAYYSYDQEKAHAIVLTSSLVERLSLDELKSVIGHEIGHLLFGHSIFKRVVCHVFPDWDKMPPFLRGLIDLWEKLGEMSADRVGLLAVRDFGPALRTEFKMTAGLDMDFFKLDKSDYLDLVDSMIAEMGRSTGSRYATHPVNPARVKALEVFYNSKTYKECIAGKDPSDDKELDEKMTAVIDVLRRVPKTSLDGAKFDFFLGAGVMLLKADETVDDREYDYLVNVLAGEMFWPPDQVQSLLENLGKSEETMAGAASFLVENYPQEVRWLFEVLVRLMLRDGVIDDRELDLLLKIGTESLRLPRPEAVGMVLNQVRTEFVPKQ